MTCRELLDRINSLGDEINVKEDKGVDCSSEYEELHYLIKQYNNIKETIS